MKINLAKAIKAFYPNPSFDQIYKEAVANAIDAGASEIKIGIKLRDPKDTKTVTVKISDNGIGFNKENFERFSELLKAQSDDHKGLGRLVYLAYFDRVLVKSCYKKNSVRTFAFDSKFKGKSEEIASSDNSESGTILEFHGFNGKKLHSINYLKPNFVKQILMKEFMPTFFERSKRNEILKIEIKLEINDESGKIDTNAEIAILSTEELPKFKVKSFKDNSIDFYQNIDIHYRISHDKTVEKSVLTAICVDGRAIDFDLIPIEAVPMGHQIEVFFVSDFFIGKSNASRQKLELPEDISERDLRNKFRDELKEILNLEIPSIIETNNKIKNEIEKTFPHLIGFYNNNYPGVMVKTQVIDEAQREYFNEQKVLLECENLSDEQYEIAVEHSSRSLMEYVLYRARIIEKLKSRKSGDSEDSLHNIIVPKRTEFHKKSWDEDYFKQNIWLLDDKYMCYDTILSDQELKKLKDYLNEESTKDDDGRPDVAIVFSSDPDASERFSVVIAEIKKEGIALAKQEEVVSQIKQRARRLLQYYPTKIERIWFFAVSEITSEFRISLKESGYREFFSFGQLFYNQQPILLNEDSPAILVDVVIMNYDALVKDAQARNETFMKILRSRISEFTTSQA
jgi:hypothetical protein